MKKINYILLCGCFLGIIQSCSKTSSTASPCKIITVRDTYNGTLTTFNLTYNNNGKISTIQNTSTTAPYTEVFTYSGNVILASKSGTGGVFQSSDSILLNSAGLMTYNIQRDASNNFTVYTYTYDGNNQLLKSTYQYNNGAITTTTDQYTNGDFTSSSDGTTTTTYTYYTNKASEDGDYIHIVQLISYGALAIQSAHLIESTQSGSTINNFNYTFDNTGKITTLTATNGSNIETITYQYQCN